MKFELVKSDFREFVKWNGLRNVMRDDIVKIKNGEYDYYQVILGEYLTDIVIDKSDNIVDFDRTLLLKMVLEEVMNAFKEQYGFDYIKFRTKEAKDGENDEIQFILDKYPAEKRIVKEKEYYNIVDYKINL